MIGKTISHYQIGEKLGEGGMGVVYKARDTSLDRYVALKLLPADKLASPERKQRFIQEAKAASALNHPHIVTIYEISQEDGNDFISMEYVAGKTLDALIPRNGMRLGEALKYAVQIADALAAAHAAGIIHRDIKPSNIMVGDDGRVRVLDFGLAKLAEQTLHASPEAPTVTAAQAGPVTSEGIVLGTPNYMSPEQAQGLSIDVRSDIFSFGAVLYEMITGRRAFQGDSAVKTMAAIVQEEPEVLPGEVPDDLRRLVTRCLRKDPERRLGEMRSVRVMLEDLKEESDSGNLRALSDTSLPKRKRGVVVPVIIAVALLGFVGGWLVRTGSEQDTEEFVLAPVPFTSYAGQERHPYFSPDGERVVFSWIGGAGQGDDLYVRLIGDESKQQLTASPNTDLSPAWSPDGRQIAFVRSGPEIAEIRLIPSIGGVERIVATIDRGIFRQHRWLDWCPDGKHLIVADRQDVAEPWALFRVDTETGEKLRLTSPPATHNGDWSPRVSPEGSQLAFARSPGSYSSIVMVQDLDESFAPSGDPRQVLSSVWSSAPFWSADGREILFASGSSDRPQLARVPAKGGKSEHLAYAADSSEGSVSRAGNRLVYVRRRVNHDIWRASLPEGEKMEPLLFSTYRETTPKYSPDGSRIAFASSQSGYREIWVSDSDGANPVQLTELESPLSTAPYWSPDGSKIVFQSIVDNQRDIFVIRASGGKPTKLTDHPADDNQPSWSPNDKWIYFSSSRDGRQRIFRMPADGGDPKPITEGQYALESPDGRELYVVRSTRPRSVWRVPLDGGQEVMLWDSVHSEGKNLELTSEALFNLSPGPDTDGKRWLLRLPFATGKPERVFELPGVPFVGLSVAPDGKHVLFTQASASAADLMLVENFR
jgi:eukaryotic-like serine/threonine-protein kinase